MERPDWLVNIGDLIPAIQDVAKQCDQPFQVKCFELLLHHALTGSPAGFAGAGGGIPPDASRRFLGFLQEHDIAAEDLAQIMDISEGEIFVADLGTSNADRQRRLAALLALRNYAVEGDPRLLKEDLRDRSKMLGFYDPANFSTNIRDFQYEKTRVFSSIESGWRVTAPGLKYVAETVGMLVSRVRGS